MNYKNLTTAQLRSNAHTADYYAAADAYADYAYVKHFIAEYFEVTGERRADYEAELERDNSFREV